MVKTSHSGEVGWVDVRGIGRCDQAVGVGGIADNACFDVLVSVLVHGLADGREDGAVVLEGSEVEKLEHTGMRSQPNAKCDSLCK